MATTMRDPKSWHGEAFNQATDSSNQIHSDEMAQAYGFRGGLVPGVTVSAYLMHPAVVAWGEQWLSAGHAEVVVAKPLYDGYAFDVMVDELDERSYRATLIDQEGTRCATGTMRLPETVPSPPVRRGDPLLARGETVPPVSREVLERFRVEGMRALPARWSADNHMASYLADPAAMPHIHRFDGAGLANGGFLLGLTNWVLAGNTYMNPWVHVQTESQFYATVAPDTGLLVECAVADLFERRGHQFVDARVDVYERETDNAVMSATLRAIYRLRPPKAPTSS
ncbi:MAG: hypothetical protein PVF57_20055 [Pseudomonadales bacterium]